MQTRPVAAALFMVSAMAVVGLIDNVLPRLAEIIGLWQFHAMRAAMALPLVIVLSLAGFGSLRPQRLGPVLLRSILIGISMLFYFTALAILPIAQALAGLFTSPIFVLLISALIFAERIGPWRILAVLLGFSGTLLVLQPDPANFDFAVLIPVAAGVFYALSAIVTRRLCAAESTLSLLAFMMLTLGILGVVGTLIFQGSDATSFVARPWVWSMQAALPALAIQAVGSVIGVFMIIKAYQLGEPSYVSIFEYSVMIFGPAYAFMLFGVPVGHLQIAGTALIALSGALIAWRA